MLVKIRRKKTPLPKNSRARSARDTEPIWPRTLRQHVETGGPHPNEEVDQPIRLQDRHALSVIVPVDLAGPRRRLVLSLATS